MCFHCENGNTKEHIPTEYRPLGKVIRGPVKADYTCLVCHKGLTEQQALGSSPHYCNGRYVFINPNRATDPVLEKLHELKVRISAVQKTIEDNKKISELESKLQAAQYSVEFERSMSHNVLKILQDTEVKLHKARTSLTAIGNRAKTILPAVVTYTQRQQELLKDISHIVSGTLEEIK